MVAISLSPFSTPTPHLDEQRRLHPRVQVKEAACYLSAHRIVIARAADVSLTGMFVQTLDPDPIGTRAHVRLVQGTREIVIAAEVTRVSFLSGPADRPGMGLRFCELKKGARRFLAQYIAHAQTSDDVHVS